MPSGEGIRIFSRSATGITERDSSRNRGVLYSDFFPTIDFAHSIIAGLLALFIRLAASPNLPSM
jgi:hypothetical protein